jgi:3-carboxy-cis,cis-muconate cycloisomerase
MLIGYDSELLRDVFISERMAEIFTFERTLQSWLDVEAALARAEARLGVVPQEAADEITRKAVASNLDLDELRAGLRETLHPVVPMVRLLTAACEGDLGGSIHWGATTQDIMDTGMVLQLREASVLVAAELQRVRDAAAALALRHRSTVMPGRTHGQHAVPITFGYKAAVWVDEADRHIEAFARTAEGVRVVQFGGAAGTLASVGEVGIRIRHELAAELDLVEPRITWHVSRDRLTTYAYELASASLFVQRLAQHRSSGGTGARGGWLRRRTQRTQRQR